MILTVVAVTDTAHRREQLRLAGSGGERPGRELATHPAVHESADYHHATLVPNPLTRVIPAITHARTLQWAIERRSEASMNPNAQQSSPASGLALSVATYLWEEYRYRHDLVWRLLFRVTSVAVLLLFVPFLTNDSVRDVADNWILVPPAIAILVVLMGIVELGLEMRLFERVKDAYREVQDVVLMDVKAWMPHSLKQSARTEKSIDFRFAWLVRLYLWLLLLASVLTFVFVLTHLSEIRSELAAEALTI
jgi:hypothetical protein